MLPLNLNIPNIATVGDIIFSKIKAIYLYV